jgi:phosphoribosylamine--glycine ligase
MKILIVGSGGREHVLAWKLARSPRVDQVYVAPGNGGTAWEASQGVAASENVELDALDLDGLLGFAKASAIDLTIVGPEAPLVAGIADAFQAQGLRIFGPHQAAAQLEGSKVFAKRFMLKHNIPTGEAAWFADYDEALAHLRQAGAPIVVKADGLAAGKGVTVCSTLAEAEKALHAAMVERVFGDAGAEVLIEECLTGQEASLLAFCDGHAVSAMPVAQDHKAAYDGDRGPNTGGMGCYAPAPLMPPALVERVTREVLQPAVDGMAARGTPYVGVLYAGLMLEGAMHAGGLGPACVAPKDSCNFKVLEFNCRFGDPETQVILPLLETDLLDVLEACVEGRLPPSVPPVQFTGGKPVSLPPVGFTGGTEGGQVRWKEASATCVVMASGGYPGAYERGKVLSGLDEANALPGVTVYHAGTRRAGAQVVTNGGRVLGVTAVAPTLDASVAQAYAGVARIAFDGAIYRTDIGAKGLAGQKRAGTQSCTETG